jgi:two-component system cell cycle response regulator
MSGSLSLALIDSLTGLYNRRYLLTYLKSLLENDLEAQRELSLMVIDVDHFKEVNDTHGHLIGDKVLQDLSEILTRTVRNIDVVARLGGEEFVIVMPDASQEIARRVSDRVLKRVAETGMAVTESGNQLNITASIGVTCRVGAEDTIDDLLQRADEAMYGAKQRGRNQVVSDSSPDDSQPDDSPADESRTDASKSSDGDSD